jgi:DNA polymerase-3 subunit epsilon
MTIFNKIAKKTGLSSSFSEISKTKDELVAEGLGIILPVKTQDALADYINSLSKVPEDKRVRYIAVFDTETTDKYNAYIVSIAIILYDMQEDSIVKEYYKEINPEMDINPEAIEVHKITPDMIKNAPIFKEVEEEITSILLQADMTCGHNIAFDLKVMEREYERMGMVNPLMNIPFFDTMVMSSNKVDARTEKGRKKQPNLGEALTFFGLEQPSGSYHNALTDTKAALELFKALFREE